MKLELNKEDIEGWIKELERVQVNSNDCQPTPSTILMGLLVKILEIWAKKGFRFGFRQIPAMLNSGRHLIIALNDYKRYRKCVE